jgi:hypothetical protein
VKMPTHTHTHISLFGVLDEGQMGPVPKEGPEDICMQKGYG